MADPKFENREEAIKALGDMRESIHKNGADITEIRAAYDKFKVEFHEICQKMAELGSPSQIVTPEGNGGEYRLRGYFPGIGTQKEGSVKMALRTKPLVIDGKDTGELQYGLLDDPNPCCEWQRALQKAVEDRVIVKWVLSQKKERGAIKLHEIPTPICDARVKSLLDSAPNFLKRVFADSTGVGAEWADDVLLPELFRELRMARRVEALFRSIEMSTKTYELPFGSDTFTPTLGGIPTNDNPAMYPASSAATAKRTLNAVSMIIRAVVDEDADEDTIFSSVDPILRPMLLSAAIDGMEDALINGDTTASHQDDIANWNPGSRWDSAVFGGSNDHRRSFIGLRARAFDVSNATDRASTTYALFMALRASLASPHGSSGDLVCIVNEQHLFVKLMQLTEVVTLEKYGASATVLTGELARLGGVPLIPSEFLTGDLAASGLYTGSGTKTGMLMLNKTRFVVGVRKREFIALHTDVTRGIRHLVMKVRKAFGTVDSSTKKNVGLSINLETS